MTGSFLQSSNHVSQNIVVHFFVVNCRFIIKFYNNVRMRKPILVQKGNTGDFIQVGGGFELTLQSKIV